MERLPYKMMIFYFPLSWSCRLLLSGRLFLFYGNLSFTRRAFYGWSGVRPLLVRDLVSCKMFYILIRFFCPFVIYLGRFLSIVFYHILGNGRIRSQSQPVTRESKKLLGPAGGSKHKPSYVCAILSSDVVYRDIDIIKFKTLDTYLFAILDIGIVDNPAYFILMVSKISGKSLLERISLALMCKDNISVLILNLLREHITAPGVHNIFCRLKILYSFRLR